MLANRYFSTANDCTAILCASDTLAIGCMQAAIEHGYSIPQDLSIIGFDNISFAALPQINLTSVDQPKEQMAVSAVDLLIDRIQHPDLPISRLILPTELVKRESCRLINSTNK